MNKPLHLLLRIQPTISHRIIPRLTAKYRPSQIRMMTSSPPKRQQQPPTQPRFSQGSDVVVSGKALSALLASDGVGGRWTLTADGEGVERMFRFKTFAKTWVCLFFAPILGALFVTGWVLWCCLLGYGGGDALVTLGRDGGGRRPVISRLPLFFC